jgi:hypothetical protein
VLRRAYVCLSAGVLALSLPAASKTLATRETLLAGAQSSTVLAAQAAVNADTARLQTLFGGLEQHAQSERGEQRLAELMRRELAVLGFELEHGGEPEAVLAILRNGRGPTLLYRADTGSHGSLSAGTDAVTRTASERPGAHRCGPDLHAIWMLGMAKALVSLRAQWAGTLVLVAQPPDLQTTPEPQPVRGSPGSLAIPTPDLLLVLRAAPAPIGSLLSIQGARRPGTDEVDVSYETIGNYAGPRSVTALATTSPRAHGLPENVHFGYLLVGVEEPPSDAEPRASEDSDLQLAEDAATPWASTDSAELTALQLNAAAIPLGSKLATVAVLELLSKTPRAANPPAAANPLDIALHRY